jgi:hypothetical protein
MRLLQRCDAISIKIYNWICIKIVTVMFIILFIILLGISEERISIKEILTHSNEFIESLAKEELEYDDS